MPSSTLNAAKKAKNDEFYTQFSDIQKEINAYIEYNPDVFRDKTVLLPCDDPEWSNFTKFFAKNFENFWLKKLISTSFANESKIYKDGYQPTLFETENPKYDKNKTRVKWKIFTLTHDTNQNWKIDVDDLERDYLQWDWDFRSEEVKKLRDESDIIITNPPFSLFREFVEWIMEGKKDFLIIWNQSSIANKDFFPLIKDNKVWIWVTMDSSNRWFQLPDSFTEYHKIENGKKYAFVAWPLWFTNIEHWRRHQPLSLMTMADNIKYSKHKDICECGYKKYDNFDAIDVSNVDSIPNDYEWIMGVPVSFLRKYCPEQFEIIWLDRYTAPKKVLVWWRLAIDW